MKKSPDYKLYISMRSPFARRIRLRMEALTLNFEEVVMDVFNPPATYFEVNPLARVPALEICKTGEVIVDSSQIDEYLKDQYGTHDIFNLNGISKAKACNISGLATGLMELIVTRFLELLKHQSKQDTDTIIECDRGIRKTLKWFEGEFEGPYFSGENIKFWDFDIGSALGYCKLRVSDEILNDYPSLNSYYSKLCEVQQFMKSAPPK